MKKLLALLSLSLFFASSCGPTGPTMDDAVTFNDQLVKAEKLCVLFEKQFFDVCQTLDSAQIKQAYEAFRARLDSAAGTMKSLKEVPEFAGFRNSGTALVEGFRKMISREYVDYARYYCIPAEKYTEEDEKKCVALAAAINGAIEPLVKNFTSEQEAFAKKWNLMLVDRPDSLITK
jgi:hypothetical protein